MVRVVRKQRNRRPGTRRKPRSLSDTGRRFFFQRSMGLYGSAGNSEETEDKNRDLATFYSGWVMTAEAMLQKNPWMVRKMVVCCDLTSGPGVNKMDDGRLIDGSPLIAKRVFSRLPTKFLFFEKNEESARKLAAMLPHSRFYEQKDSRIWLSSPLLGVNVFRSDFEMLRVMDPCLRFSLALLYWDANATLPPIAALSELFLGKKYQRADILLHVAATTIKRARESAVALDRNARMKDLDDIRRAIPKLKWLISPPRRNWHWCFLFGTNYESYSEYKKIGFVSADSFQGRMNLMKAALTVDDFDDQVRIVEERSGRVCEDRRACGNEIVKIPVHDGAVGWSRKNSFYWSCTRCQKCPEDL